MAIEFLIVLIIAGLGGIGFVASTIVDVISKVFLLSAQKEKILNENKMSSLEQEILLYKSLENNTNTEKTYSPQTQKKRA